MWMDPQLLKSHMMADLLTMRIPADDSGIDIYTRTPFVPGSPRRLSPRGHGYRYLPRFKTVGGKRYQLHATRGWKCVGKA